MTDSPYRKKDQGPPLRMLAQETELVRVSVLGGLVQQIMLRDHGQELADWSAEAVKEAAGLMDGIADAELLREFFMAMNTVQDFNILEEIHKLNKQLPTDG